MKIYSAICIALVLALFSCKKERQIHISAKNAVTGEPYSGLTYYVVREKTGSLGEEFKTIASGTLNSNGEAVLSLKLSKEHSYTIRVEEPQNTCYNKQISYTFANQEDIFECPFEFAECAYLKQNVTNINCQGATDYMIYYLSNSVNSLPSQGTEFNGCSSYSATTYSKVPFGNYYYQWQVTRNGITNTYFDTIYLNQGEYRTHSLNY